MAETGLARPDALADPAAFLTSRGIKATRSREQLLQSLMDHACNQEHVTAEQLERDLTVAGKSIGLATIYRVLAMFEKYGVVRREQFARGQTVFEFHSERNPHHHMVRTDGTPVLEFSDALVEHRLREIAEKNGYQYLGSELIVHVGVEARTR